MKRLSFFLLFVFCATVGQPVANQSADKIYRNARIWTGNEGQPWAEALAVREDRLLAVGTNQAIMKLKAAETTVVDLQGNFVAPGFNDAHLHFLTRDEIEIEESDNLYTIQRRMSEFAKQHPEATWIVGRGWGYPAFPEGVPNRRYLDEVISDRPVFLRERDGHMALANTKALQIAGISKNSKDPEHGRIIHDEAGEPSGELQEAAMDLISNLIPAPSEQELYVSLKQLLDRAASFGLTSAQNAHFDESELPIFDRVRKENGLKLRFRWAVPFKQNPTAEDFAKWRALGEHYPSHLMKFGAAKGMLDGVVDAQTAAMFEPYTTGKSGIAMWKQDELNQTAVLYDKEGLQIMLHAIGDQAIAMALDAYEYVQKVNGPRDSRHRVEHIEVPRMTDILRFRRLGVIASTQALFANPDKTTLENYSPLLGPDRAARANAFKLFDDAGAIQAFGSDWPVFSMEVLRGIYCAATRKTPEGTPRKGYFPQHRISVEAALRHFTVDAAYASFDEKEKGTLTAGKFADFVVLSRNIIATSPERLLQTKVLMTVMGGTVTYQAK